MHEQWCESMRQYEMSAVVMVEVVEGRKEGCMKVGREINKEQKR